MNILEALDDEHLFAPHFTGESWSAWKGFSRCLPSSQTSSGALTGIAGGSGASSGSVNQDFCRTSATLFRRR